MKITTEYLREILEDFLERWQDDDINQMTLDDYVGLGNKDTFCQWVETKTKLLGSINGLPSIKFGIYKRKDPNKKPKNYNNDKTHSWLKGYGDARDKAFENVKKDVIDTIYYSKKGEFNKIDDILLPNLFKWKVAFLFSNERLIPIFKKQVLFKIANHYGLKTNRKTKISEIQDLLISNKPVDQDVYHFMWVLYDEFGKDDSKNLKNRNKINPSKRKRKGTSKRNTESQFRTPARSYVAEQKHNKIQEELHKLLINEYGAENVILEENYVDIKLIQKDYLNFYEVKSASYASECIKQALGQILLYTHNDEDERVKNIYVVGQYAPTEKDKDYISFVKNILKIDFDYLSIAI